MIECHHEVDISRHHWLGGTVVHCHAADRAPLYASALQAIHKSQHIISAARGLPVVELPGIHDVCSYEARSLGEIWLPTLKGKLKGKLFKPVSLVMPHFSRVRHHTTGRRRTVLLLLARAKRALRFRHTCQKQSWNFGMGYTAKKVLVFALSQ